MDVTSLLGIMANVVLPTFLMASAGFVARRYVGVDPRALTRLALYILVPALVFNSMLTSTLGGDEITRVGIFATVLTAIMVALGVLFARLLRASRTETSGMALGVGFINATNYGLPVALFAFGQEGFDRAVVFAAFGQILTFSIAVFIAARGRADWRRALFSVAQLPVMWAAVAALGLRLFGLEVPTPVHRAVTVLSNGAIPIVVLLLGMQVASMQLHHIRLATLVASAGRLGVSPLVGLLLVAMLQPDPLTGRILVLEAAMPTAVNVAVLAAEYDAEPALVSSIVLVTTALSMITLTGWVAYLQSL